MIKEILIDSDIINERSMEWDVLKNQDISTELVQNLWDTLSAATDRSYLCSNEIGYKERAFALKFSDDYKIFMNPLYQNISDLKLVREYDPLTKKQYIIPRYTDVTLCYQNCMGKIEAIKFNELASAVVAQAMDCLDGIHSSDYGLEITEEFDNATDEEWNQVINEYLRVLGDLRKNLDKDLQTNEETREEWNAFRFTKAKASGEFNDDSNDSPKLNRKQRRFFEKLAKKFRRKN